MAAIGVAITLVLMLALAYSIYVYADNPDDDGAMIAMSALSSGMMVFLIVFAVIYTRPKPADEYMEIYQGICSRCGTPFGPDGVCPKCGRHRPQPRDRSIRRSLATSSRGCHLNDCTFLVIDSVLCPFLDSMSHNRS